MVFINRKVSFLIVLSVAIIVRAIYLWEQKGNPFNLFPIADSSYYILEAGNVLKGNWFGGDVFHRGGTAFYRYFLALIFAIFDENYLAVQIIQHLMGAFTCTIIFLAAEKLYGLKIALTTALWAALYSPFLFHEGLLLTSGPSLFFLALSIYFLILVLDQDRFSYALIAGISLGLSSLGRPNILLLAPLYPLWIVFVRKNIRSTSIIALILGIALTILPVTFRNYHVANDFVLVTSGGGLNFFLGNNEKANGIFHIPPASSIRNDLTMYISSQQVAENNLGRRLKASEVDRYWFNKGIEFIKESPGKAVKLYWKKFCLFWNDSEITNIYDYAYFSKYSFLLSNHLASFDILSAFGLTGAIMMLLQGSRKEKIIPVLMLTYTFSLLLFFVSSRLRMPVALFLLFSAGYIFREITGKCHPGKRLSISALAVIIFLFAHMDLGGDVKKVIKSATYFNYYQLGRKFIKSGEYEKARVFFKLALENDPTNIHIRYKLGMASEKMGDIKSAKIFYSSIIESKRETPLQNNTSPAEILAYYNSLKHLGLIYLNEDTLDKAEKYLKKALEINPVRIDAYGYLGMTYEKQGRFKEALDQYKYYLSKYPSDNNIRQRAIKLLKKN